MKKGFSREENICDFHPEHFALFTNEKEELKRLQFKFLIPKMSICILRSLVNQISKIPIASAIISAMMVLGFEKMLINLTVLSVSHVISKSIKKIRIYDPNPLVHRHQEEFKALKDPYLLRSFDFSFTSFD